MLDQCPRCQGCLLEDLEVDLEGLRWTWKCVNCGWRPRHTARIQAEKVQPEEISAEERRRRWAQSYYRNRYARGLCRDCSAERLRDGFRCQACKRRNTLRTRASHGQTHAEE